MLCPVCASLLSEEVCAGERIDRCGECGGMWVDQGELASIVQNDDAPVAVAANAKRPAQLACPRCERPLAPHEYAHDSGVVLQRCPDCRGHWIEASQIAPLAAYVASNPAIDKLAATIEHQFASERRQRLLYAMLTSKLLSGAVAAGLAIAVVLDSKDINRILSVAIYVTLPLACIWFSEEMGRRTRGTFGLARPRVTQPTPGIMVAVAGWLLLLLPVLLWILL